ncbi:hypothetical protein PsW64_05316 [Pseudovibrio sp. W64]|nr:hypothetical protein PsW64_05316 [Pseudovibrio sp. W64]KZK94589.1 hypothetical protein PsAD46_01012 [Pseudovibrio sp. Ad46]KZL01106.1 hypothetical protein PsW74_01901 [Pseudovibrio sp. W74]KZL01650.1 hypothetical protein PsAD5_00574 [Pseudovibrio sp. Ad5]KZL11171.1 hypothetical protein PsAD14_00922 [Pseudovibrio sp. Ad14]KZL23699.1 hypothetical protein PsWM33_02988 [Pseudovibrio sp. WM33]
MTFGLILFICVFLAILGMVVISEFSSRNKTADRMIAGLDADLSKE